MNESSAEVAILRHRRAVFSWLADGGRSAAPNGLTKPKSFLKSSPQVRNALDERNMCTPTPLVGKRTREYPKCKLNSHVCILSQGLNFLRFFRRLYLPRPDLPQTTCAYYIHTCMVYACILIHVCPAVPYRGTNCPVFGCSLCGWGSVLARYGNRGKGGGRVQTDQNGHRRTWHLKGAGKQGIALKSVCVADDGVQAHILSNRIGTVSVLP